MNEYLVIVRTQDFHPYAFLAFQADAPAEAARYAVDSFFPSFRGISLEMTEHLPGFYRYRVMDFGPGWVNVEVYGIEAAMQNYRTATWTNPPGEADADIDNWEV